MASFSNIARWMMVMANIPVRHFDLVVPLDNATDMRTTETAGLDTRVKSGAVSLLSDRQGDVDSTIGRCTLPTRVMPGIRISTMETRTTTTSTTSSARVPSAEQTDANHADFSLKRALDPCCGSRMMWFNRANPDVMFGDIRSETLQLTDNSRGNASGLRTIRVAPDTLLDFRALPYPDESFKLVAFDPPHLVNAGPRSWLAAKYGKLSKNWRDDLRQGFTECFRVLDRDGVLVFKWNENQVKLSEVLALTPHEPMFGNTSGKKAGTHWLVFMKPREA